MTNDDDFPADRPPEAPADPPAGQPPPAERSADHPTVAPAEGSPEFNPAGWTEIARVADFPPGSRRCVDVDGVQMVVFNVGGRYHAIEDLCTHEAEALSGGRLEGLEIVCPRHEAHFSLLSGEALTPPAYEPVTVFPVRVEAGRIFVRDHRFD